MSNFRKVSNFKTDVKDGEEAENWTLNSLLHMRKPYSDDIRIYNGPDDSPEYDLKIIVKDAETKKITHSRLIEVKYDMRSKTTGNFYFELISNSKNDRLGAGLASTSDILALVQPYDDVILKISFLNFLGLKGYAVNSLLTNRHKMARVATNIVCSGILLPLDIILDKYEYCHVYYDILNDTIITNKSEFKEQKEKWSKIFYSCQ